MGFSGGEFFRFLGEISGGESVRGGIFRLLSYTAIFKESTPYATSMTFLHFLNSITVYWL